MGQADGGLGVRTWWGWGQFLGEALPWVEGGGLLLTHSGATSEMLGSGCGRAAITRFPNGVPWNTSSSSSLGQGAH